MTHLRLGAVTVRDPDALLAAESRAVLVRALGAPEAPPGSVDTVIDVAVSLPPDDEVPSLVHGPSSHPLSASARVVVRLRATWTHDGTPHEATSEGVAEVPLGATARDVGEGGSLARREALDQAADRLAETLADLGL